MRIRAASDVSECCLPFGAPVDTMGLPKTPPPHPPPPPAGSQYWARDWFQASHELKHVFKINDNENNFLVIPEHYPALNEALKFKKIKKIIWWLSVDNYINSKFRAENNRFLRARGHARGCCQSSLGSLKDSQSQGPRDKARCARRTPEHSNSCLGARWRID